MVYKLTKINTAINRILKNIQPLNKKTKILLDEANQRINYNTLKSNLSLPETLNSAELSVSGKLKLLFNVL